MSTKKNDVVAEPYRAVIDRVIVEECASCARRRVRWENFRRTLREGLPELRRRAERVVAYVAMIYLGLDLLYTRADFSQHPTARGLVFAITFAVTAFAICVWLFIMAAVWIEKRADRRKNW